MQISLRSQLAAGVAVAGAAAIAVTPIAQPQLMSSLDRVSAQIQLTQFSNPITALIDSLGMGAAYTFGTQAGGFANVAYGDNLPVIPFDPTGAFYGEVPIGWLPQLLNPINIFSVEADDVVGAVSGTPLLQAFGSNLSGYTYAALEGLNGLAGGLGAAVFGVPFAVFQVVSAVLSGGTIPDISTLIQETIIDPVVDGLTAFTNAATFITSNLLENVTTLVAGLPALAVSAFGQATGALGYLVNQTVGAFTNAFAAGTIEGGWNALVDGLLGPAGVAGSVLKLTVGFGVGDPTDDPSTFIPSVRQLFSGFGVAGNEQITNGGVPPVPTSGASLRRGGAAAAASSATVAASSDTSAKKPAGHRSGARAGAAKAKAAR